MTEPTQPPTVAPADVTTFRDELAKLGFTDEQRDDAVTVLPYLLAHWSPQDAAEALASVVNPTGSNDMLGCAMAARSVASFAARHPIALTREQIAHGRCVPAEAYEEVGAEVERLTAALAAALADDALFARPRDGESTLTGNLALDMAAYAQRLKTRAETAQAEVDRLGDVAFRAGLERLHAEKLAEEATTQRDTARDEHAATRETVIRIARLSNESRRFSTVESRERLAEILEEWSAR